MRSMNRVFLIGHVGQAPRVRTTPTGRKVANFTLATNEVWRDAGGQRQQRTEWHRIVAFGDLADFAEKYIQKGRFILVEGRLQTRQYTDGQGISRYVTEVVARDIGFLEPRAGRPRGSRNSSSPRRLLTSLTMPPRRPPRATRTWTFSSDLAR